MGEKEENQLEEQQKPHKISGEDFVGALCKVVMSENKAGFMGRIKAYDAEYDELKISGHRIEAIPVMTYYGAPVKIEINSREQLAVLYGAVRKQDTNFWWVTLEHAEKHFEQRESFRQPLNGMDAMIQRGDNKQEAISCNLIDISLTGICISCKTDLQIGENIVIQKVCLYPNASHSYTFDCEVQRAFIRGQDNRIIDLGAEGLQGSDEAKKQKPEEKYYGCSFRYISSEEREKLCKDIFFVQQQQRRLN